LRAHGRLARQRLPAPRADRAPARVSTSAFDERHRLFPLLFSARAALHLADDPILISEVSHLCPTSPHRRRPRACIFVDIYKRFVHRNIPSFS